MKGNCHVLTNDSIINHLNSLKMKKNSKITSNLKSQKIVDKALSSSNEEQLDLYKAIFGGRASASCPVVAVSTRASRASGYDKQIDPQFLLAAPMDPGSPSEPSASASDTAIG